MLVESMVAALVATTVDYSAGITVETKGEKMVADLDILSVGKSDEMLAWRMGYWLDL